MPGTRRSSSARLVAPDALIWSSRITVTEEGASCRDWSRNDTDSTKGIASRSSRSMSRTPTSVIGSCSGSLACALGASAVATMSKTSGCTAELDLVANDDDRTSIELACARAKGQGNLGHADPIDSCNGIQAVATSLAVDDDRRVVLARTTEEDHGRRQRGRER